MKIGNFEITRRKKNPQVQDPGLEGEERSLAYGLAFNSIGGYRSDYAMKLSAVYAATNQISNACAVLPINVYKTSKGRRVLSDHPVQAILNRRPNSYMNHFDFIKMMIESVILKGEGFALIERDSNTLNVKALHYIPTDMVQVLATSSSSSGMKYLVTGMDKAVDSINMIHLYQHQDPNTHRGISTLSYANRTLKSASEAEIHSSNFFKSGANLSGILKSAAPLNNKQKEEIRDSWSAAFSSNSGDISVAVLPNGIEYQPISINPADSQLLQSRQYDIIEICRFFNISPVKLFDLTNSSYRTAEQVQLSFVQDTVYPYVVMLQEEFNRKIFRPSELDKYDIECDFAELLATDKQTLASYYKTLLVNGIMSLNEVRDKLSLPPVENGDEHLIQLNMTTLNTIATGLNIKNTLDNKFAPTDKDNDEAQDQDNDQAQEEEKEKEK